MSLVTDHRQIIIERDDLSDDPGDMFVDSAEEEHFLRALRCGKSDSTPPRNRAHSATGGPHSQPGAGSLSQRRPRDKPRRRADPAAVERLIAPTTASSARAQRKFIERAPEANALPSSPPRVSKVATRAGERLYACAIGQRRRLESMREAHAEALRLREERPSFRPVITRLAMGLAADGYRPPHERYGAALARQQRAELQRADERNARGAAGCTFHPVVSPVSARLASAHQRRSAPFSEVGDRLFVDGGRRLIRQQLRQRIVEQRAACCVVGGYEMSADEASAVAARLRQWGEARDRRVEDTREALFNRCTTEQENKNKNKNRNRSMGKRREKSPSSGHCVGDKSEGQNDINKNQKAPGGEVSQRGTGERDAADALRALRCRALFVKYASSHPSQTLCLRDVRRQVRELFPADSGLLAALTADFTDDDAVIDRSAFVASLLRFVSRHGPQPWLEPSLGREASNHRDVSPLSVALSSSTEGTAAPGDVVAELEAMLGTPGRRSTTASPKRCGLSASASASSSRRYHTEDVMREARKLIFVRGV